MSQFQLAMALHGFVNQQQNGQAVEIRAAPVGGHSDG